MLDFEIKQEILPVIQVNFEEMKKALSDTMDQYKGIIVTDESLSACKAEQKVLAGIRTKIDNYRKDKKKEMSKPITDFENQCKELIALVESVEKPIKEGIQIFDDKKKEEKRQKALGIIREAIEARQLKQKFADKLTVLDKYMNLTASIKSIKEDVEQRVFYLVEEQVKEEETIQIIRTTIDNVNTTINTQIQFKDFLSLVENGYPIPKIIERINQMAEKIRLAENPPKVEPITETPVNEIPKSSTQPIQQTSPIKAHEQDKLFFVKFKIVGTASKTAALGKFLRDNFYDYDVLEKGAVE